MNTKRNHITTACNHCRRRKARCLGKPICQRCVKFGLSCVFIQPTRKRGPPKTTGICQKQTKYFQNESIYTLPSSLQIASNLGEPLCNPSLSIKWPFSNNRLRSTFPFPSGNIPLNSSCLRNFGGNVSKLQSNVQMTKAFHEKGGDLNGCYKSIDSDNFFVKFQNSQELDMNAWDWFLQPRPTALKTENFFDDSKKSLDSDFSESFYSTESESPASSQEMLSPTTFQLPNLDQIRASSQLITDKSDTFPRLAKPKIELENQIFPSTINNNLGNDTTFYHPYHIQSLPSSPSSNLLPFYYSAATDMTFRQ